MKKIWECFFGFRAWAWERLLLALFAFTAASRAALSGG